MSDHERDYFEANFDITGKIGELFPRFNEKPEWPMYSYSRPAYTLWNAIGARLASNGWTEEQIGEWLRSKGTRWALDGKLGDMLIALGHDYADKMTAPPTKETV